MVHTLCMRQWSVYLVLLGWPGILIFLIEIICWAPWISQFRALSSLTFFLGHSLEIDFYSILNHTGSFFLSVFKTSYKHFGTQCIYSKKQDPYCFIALPKQQLSFVEMQCKRQFTPIHFNSPLKWLLFFFKKFTFQCVLTNSSLDNW